MPKKTAKNSRKAAELKDRWARLRLLELENAGLHAKLKGIAEEHEKNEEAWARTLDDIDAAIELLTPDPEKVEAPSPNERGGLALLYRIKADVAKLTGWDK